MSRPPPPRQFDPSVPELMDREGNDLRLVQADLRIIERINRYLGGHWIVRHYLRAWRRPRLTVLDLATGGGDIPRLVVRWARREGIKVQVTAVDRNPEILRVAREWSTNFPEIEFQQADLLQLPFARKSFDLVLNALTLHHFAAEDAVKILRSIQEIACLGYLVNDLRRRRSVIMVSRLMARTLIANPIAKFDAPTSCARAFTVAELRELAAAAGLRQYEIRPHWTYRMALVGRC